MPGHIEAGCAPLRGPAPEFVLARGDNASDHTEPFHYRQAFAAFCIGWRYRLPPRRARLVAKLVGLRARP